MVVLVEVEDDGFKIVLGEKKRTGKAFSKYLYGGVGISTKEVNKEIPYVLISRTG